MGGSSGQTAPYQRLGANTGMATMQSAAQAQTDPQIARLMAAYANGSLGYTDALGAASGMSLDSSGLDAQIRDLEAQKLAIGNAEGEDGKDDQAAHEAAYAPIQDKIDQLKAQKSSNSNASSYINDLLATGAATGNRFASDQVMNDQLYRGLFGANSMSSRAQDDYTSSMEALKGRDPSYGLNKEDLAAYGQASDNIARISAAQGQSLAQAMADRGLSSAPSGVVSQGFSNLYGNQHEQLAQSQLQIAQNRINTAQGLAQARNNAASSMVLGLGNLGRAAQGQYYNQNLAGMGARYGLSTNAAQLALQNQAQAQEIQNELFSQKQSTKRPSFGEAISGGLISGAGYSANQTTAGPGNFVNGFSTALGKSYGGGGMGGGGSAGSAGGGQNQGMNDYWSQNPYSTGGKGLSYGRKN